MKKRPTAPQTRKDAPRDTARTTLRLIACLADQRLRLTLVCVAILGFCATTVYAPYLCARFIDALLAELRAEGPFAFAWDPLGRLLAWVAGAYALNAAFNWVCVLLMASVSETLCFNLRRRIAEKIGRLPLAYFDSHKPGEVLSRVTNDLDRVSETLQNAFLRFLTSFGCVVGSLAFMAWYSPTLTALFCLFVALSILITDRVARANLEWSSERQAATARLTGLVAEHYTGREVIQAYNRQPSSARKIGLVIGRLAQKERMTDFLMNSVTPFIHLLSRLAQAVLLLIACWWLLKGRMTIGAIHAYFQYINTCADPLAQASYLLNAMQSALASAERTFDFLDAAEERTDANAPLRLGPPRGSVIFSHVRFGYHPKRVLMDNVNLVVRPGQKVAIVGSTGAGKTTLVNLLMRFYDVNRGHILVDGTPISAVPRADLRRRFGMVLQDTWLFEGTVAENIAYARPDATRDEVVRAAKLARADHFIRALPQGYDTRLKTGAETLSVGQRQLLTIARVFLADPPMLILDEATSSVDTRTEAEIAEAMRGLMRGRTAFVIAHRLSTIRDADLILYMERGDITEKGTHEELLRKGGAYAALYASQFA